MESFDGKNEIESLYFQHTVKIKQPNTMTEPLEKRQYFHYTVEMKRPHPDDGAKTFKKAVP